MGWCWNGIRNKPCSFYISAENKKKPTIASGLKGWRRPTLPGFTLVPSALSGLTSEFGKGSGVLARCGHLRLVDGGFVCHRYNVINGWEYTAVGRVYSKKTLG